MGFRRAIIGCKAHTYRRAGAINFARCCLDLWTDCYIIQLSLLLYQTWNNHSHRHDFQHPVLQMAIPPSVWVSRSAGSASFQCIHHVENRKKPHGLRDDTTLSRKIRGFRACWYVSPSAYDVWIVERLNNFTLVGPCELSISHPDAINALYSAQSGCIKGPWYDILQPYRSLFGVRDRVEHRRRRKVWHDAFQLTGMSCLTEENLSRTVQFLFG